MPKAPAASDLERRKRVRLRLRGDLNVTPQKYEGKTFYVVKDPVSLRYYRFKEQEHFLLGFMDGKHTLDEAQKEYEKRFRPERLTLEDLEGFAQQLLTAGLAQNESPKAGKQLLDRRKKRKRSQLLQLFTNVLYIKIPLYDPDALLNRMMKYVWFIFTPWFFALSVGVMLGAGLLVLTHFDTFRDKLPSYHEFFSFKTVIYLWIALGVVKVIHEFGHGLSCKRFGGEVHEMGFLFLVFSPCLYCNVSDSWTLPSKWKRIIISAAGIYVELIIAALATFVWWNTPTQPFINNLALSLMVVCSVSTVVFNANPLMRFDGYYVLADWIEIPNLREKSNRYLTNRFMETCLGIEVPPEPYMAPWRKNLFVFYAIAAYVYRWIITYFILWFIYNFLKPYKLGVLSAMLAVAALGSMIGWPLYRLGKNIHRRGRLPDMKSARVTATCAAFVALVLAVCFVPVPVSRVYADGVVQLPAEAADTVYVVLARINNESGGTYRAVLEEVLVKDGQRVARGDLLARFRCPELEGRIRVEETRVGEYSRQLGLLWEKRLAATALAERDQYEGRIADAQEALGDAEGTLRRLQRYRRLGEVVRAPRDGVVMLPPGRDEVGKPWDKDRPLCKVGEMGRLQVLIPVEPADYSLLQEDMGGRYAKVSLPADVRVPGMGAATWRGWVSQLPESDADTIDPALANRTGGPVPVKPGGDPDRLVPQTQQYLVLVDVENPNAAGLRPGVRAKVKIHCEKRSIAWWLWRSINDTFNLGLM